MKSKSRPKQSQLGRVAPCLPVEVTEICLRFYAELERERIGEASLKHIGLLRLVSRHFRDVFTKELFNSVTVHLFHTKPRPTTFLNIVRENNDLLKHIRHVTIWFCHSGHKVCWPDIEEARRAVRIFSQAPLRALTIEGWDKDFPYRHILDALHTLRCVRSLQTLNIWGSVIPPFLVCGHSASTQLKSIHFLCASSPDKLTSESLRYGPSIGPDSILARRFQPFAKIEELSFPNGADVPEYFPLQDFGSAYYPSNGRIPFTLPALRKLTIGDPDPSIHPPGEGAPLNAEDYNVLGTLLSRAPRLETLRIIDEFWSHRGIDNFAPLVEQLPLLKNLHRLELLDLNNQQDEAINSISDILDAFPPIPALKTLCINFRWYAGDANATRTCIYFSEAWQKLQQALASPTFASLRVLTFGVKIEISHEDSIVETFGPEEVDDFKEALVDLYSRDGKLDVTVNVEVEDT